MLASEVLVTEGASVNHPLRTPVPLPFCSDFLEVPSFNFLEDVDFAFLVMLPGKAVGLFFFVALVVIGFGMLLLFK